jgi:ligand-binding sensor domain-containing protein
MIVVPLQSTRLAAARSRAALLALACLAVSVRPATADLSPEKPIRQYARTIWEASAGLPQNSVQALLQTRDGYVWLGTEEGLVRFDGERFEVFNRSTTPELPGRDVKALFEAKDGSLWIGIVGGVARLKDGRFTGYTLATGLAHDWILAVTTDRAGRVWLGTSGGGLLRFVDGKSTAFTSRNGLPDNFVLAVRETADGSIERVCPTTTFPRCGKTKTVRCGSARRKVWCACTAASSTPTPSTTDCRTMA